MCFQAQFSALPISRSSSSTSEMLSTMMSAKWNESLSDSRQGSVRLLVARPVVAVGDGRHENIDLNSDMSTAHEREGFSDLFQESRAV